MRRREFIAGLGSTVAWPVAERAQQGDRVRRVGVLMGFADNDSEARVWIARFTQGLSDLSWIEGRNNRNSLGSRQQQRSDAVIREGIDQPPA